jgi:hypothetical protein
VKHLKIIILCFFGLLIVSAQGQERVVQSQIYKSEDDKIIAKRIRKQPNIKRSVEMPFEDIAYYDFKDTKGKLFVVGIFKKGIPVILLSEDSSTCIAETSNTGSYDHPDGPLEITNITRNNKRNGKKYFGALMGVTEANYQYLKLETFKDDKLAKSIYRTARKFEHPKTPYYMRLLSSNSNMWLIPKQHTKIVVAQLKIGSDIERSSDGPLFIFKKNQTYPLKGECAKDIKVFSINGRIIIRYVHSGCDNGEHVIRVYDLSENVPKLIYTNDAWSD